MSRPFRLELAFGNVRHILNRTASEALLSRLDAFGADAGPACLRLRDDLRRALSTTEAQACAGQACAEVETQVVLEPLSDGAAACYFCESPGDVRTSADGRALRYVCRNPKCVRFGLEAEIGFFTTGSHAADT